MTVADLIVSNANIVTMDESRPRAQALAALGGRILALGPDAEIAGLAGPGTRRLDLDGRTVIPGIVDSHCHPDTAAVRSRLWIDLSPESTPDRASVLARLGQAAGETGSTGEWIAACRLNDLKSGGYPTLAELDEATGDRPLFILRTDGHIGLANSAAFAALGIDRTTPDPDFGCFDHHPETGALTGVVRETAAHLFINRILDETPLEAYVSGLRGLFGEWNALGITSVYNSLTARPGIAAYQLMRANALLTMRVGIIVSGREPGLVESFIDAGIRSGFGDDWLRVIGVEWCPDCSTSGRTAAYYEPYIGTPVPGEPADNRGMLLYEADDMKRRAIAAHKAGLQVMIEGVGDRGIDFALDAIEAALKAHPADDHRMRVEHCCYVTPRQLARIKALGVIDSSATGFMYDLGDAYIANRGRDAMRYMWPHRTLIDEGVIAPGHSDALVCRADPFAAMWSMVNRLSDTGQSLDAREAITAEEALKAYTLLGAWSGREETVKGSLAPGKCADMAVLDRDMLSIPTDEIRETRVDMTIVDGQVVHER